MSQQLFYPINSVLITAGYKNFAYRSRFGFTHYGQDMISKTPDYSIWASGHGTVLYTGYDNIFGNVLVVQYPQAENILTGKVADAVFRYCHMESVVVKAGQTVNPQTKLGYYGSTGRYSIGSHLHLEADLSTSSHTATPSLKHRSNILQPADKDTTFNPAQVLHLMHAAHRTQTLCISNSSYQGYPFVIAREDFYNRTAMI